MPRGDAIQALDSPYRQTILRILKQGRTAYSDLFNHLEPDGDDRGRFNYHLRSLRNADLVQLEDSQYRLTERGKAALILLAGVSDYSEPPPRAKRRSGISLKKGALRIVHALKMQRWLRIGLLGGTVAIVGYLLLWLFLNEVPFSESDLGLSLIVAGAAILLAGTALALREVRTKAPLAGPRLLGLMGGIVVLASTFLPWVDAFDVAGWHWGSGHRLMGLFVGIGGALTLAFASAGLVAMRVPRRNATAMAGVFGVLALSSTFLVLLAILGIAPAVIGGLHDIHGGYAVDYAIPLFGLYMSLVGASMLVLGSTWTLRRRRGALEAPASADTDRAVDGKTHHDEVDRSWQGGTIPRWWRIRTGGVPR